MMLMQSCAPPYGGPDAKADAKELLHGHVAMADGVIQGRQPKTIKGTQIQSRELQHLPGNGS